MVHKDEEVYDWFKNLYTWKKIDFLCYFLRMCHPLELRFIGSYLENLAKRDFNALRDAELKVNDQNDLKRNLSSDFDSESLSKVIVALSLLHSTNRTAAYVIYDTLCQVVQQTPLIRASSDLGSYYSESDHSFGSSSVNVAAENLSASDDTVQNLLLSLMLAVHHPALLFSECRNLQNYLQTIVQCLDKQNEDIKPKYEKKVESAPTNGSTSFTFYNSNFTGLEFLDSSSSKVLPPSRTLPHSHSAPIFKSKVNDRLSWLKDLRLQKYADNLKKFTDEQLYQFTDREFEDAGLTKEATQRLQKAIQAKRHGSHVNGLVSSSGGGGSDPSSEASSPSLSQGRQSRGSKVKRTAEKEGHHNYHSRPGHQGRSDDNSSTASSLYSSPQSSPSPPESTSCTVRQQVTAISDDSDYTTSATAVVDKSVEGKRYSAPHIPSLLASNNYVTHNLHHHHVAAPGSSALVIVSPPYLTPASMSGTVHHSQQKQPTAAAVGKSKQAQQLTDAYRPDTDVTEGLLVNTDDATAGTTTLEQPATVAPSQLSEQSSSVKQLSPPPASGSGAQTSASPASGSLPPGGAMGPGTAAGSQIAPSNLPPPPPPSQLVPPGAMTNIPPPPLAAVHPPPYVQQQAYVGGGGRYPAPPMGASQFRNGGSGMPPGQGRIPYAPYGQYPPYFHMGPSFYSPQPSPFYHQQQMPQLANGMDPMLHPSYVGPMNMLKTPGQGGFVMGMPFVHHPAGMNSTRHQVHQHYARWLQIQQPSPSCYNCGDSSHQGYECPETTIESTTAAGSYHLSYQNKEDADLS